MRNGSASQLHEHGVGEEAAGTAADEGPAFPSETVNHINDANYTTIKTSLEALLTGWEATTDRTGLVQL